MDPLYVHGAASPGAAASAAASSSSTGSTPKLSDAQRAQSQQLAMLFTAQIQQSMLASLSMLGSDEEGTTDGGGDDGMGDLSGLAGLDGLATQNSGMEALSSLYAASMNPNATVDDLRSQIASALQQAQMGGQLGGLGGGMDAAGTSGAGAGMEALLAQQLLASLDPTSASTGLDGVSGASRAGAVSNANATPAQNARTVADAARRHGVDPVVAVAMMLVESGGNARAVGDNGTSFGLFQLHKGGMLTAAGLTPEQAFDPATNADVALKSLAHEWAKGSARRSPGEIAAASQRPADPVGYARKVNAAMERARALLA